jgi:hypothetical protein
MDKKQWDEILENIFRISIGCIVLMVPVLYVGFLLHIKPLIWAPVAAVCCFYISLRVVKKFFWKKIE